VFKYYYQTYEKTNFESFKLIAERLLSIVQNEKAHENEVKALQYGLNPPEHYIKITGKEKK